MERLHAEIRAMDEPPQPGHPDLPGTIVASLFTGLGHEPGS